MKENRRDGGCKEEGERFEKGESQQSKLPSVSGNSHSEVTKREKHIGRLHCVRYCNTCTISSEQSRKPDLTKGVRSSYSCSRENIFAPYCKPCNIISKDKRCEPEELRHVKQQQN